MAAAAGKAKEVGAGGCRRHPSHRQSAGVCPFCLCDRLSRLPSAVTGANGGASGSGSASSASSSAASSVRSSGEATVASAQAAPCREARRTRLGLLMRQEETEAETAADRHGQEAAAAAAATAGEKIKAKRGNFWARLQQGSWYRKVDGCSVAHSKTSAVAIKSAAAAPKRAPLF